nr:uncharacterized protein LOC113828594 isoform X2 [Penaeus vannamei]
MGPTAVVLWMVAGTVRALGPQRVDSLYDEHYPPIHPNCTQSLTDLLLLRQEAKLSELTLAEQTSTEVLKEAVHLLADIRNSLTFDQGAGGAVSSRGRPTPVQDRARATSRASEAPACTSPLTPTWPGGQLGNSVRIWEEIWPSSEMPMHLLLL